MTKLIDTFNNLLKLVTSLATLAVLGAVVFFGLKAYHTVAELTSKPIQMPTVKLPAIEVPPIKVAMPDLGIVAGLKKIDQDLGEAFFPEKKPELPQNEAALEQAWSVWDANTKAARDAVPVQQRYGRWQNATEGSHLQGVEKFPPPAGRYLHPADGRPTIYEVFNWHWIGNKVTNLSIKCDERLQAGERLGKWLDKKDNTYVYGFKDLKPDDSNTIHWNDGTETAFSFEWVWIGDAEPTPSVTAQR